MTRPRPPCPAGPAARRRERTLRLRGRLRLTDRTWSGLRRSALRPARRLACWSALDGGDFLTRESIVGIRSRSAPRSGIVAIGQTLVILAGSLDLSVAYLIGLASLVAAETMAGDDGDASCPRSSLVLARQRRGGPGQRPGHHRARSTRSSRRSASRSSSGASWTTSTTARRARCPTSFQRLGYDRDRAGPGLGRAAGRPWPSLACGSCAPDPARLPHLRGRRRRGGRPAVRGSAPAGSSCSRTCCARCAPESPGCSSPAGSAREPPRVGTDGGYDLESIAAVVLGGTALAGGKGGVAGTVGGVLLLAVLDSVFNSWRSTPSSRTWSAASSSSPRWPSTPGAGGPRR